MTPTIEYVRQSHLGTADKCLRALQYDIEGGPPEYSKGGGIARAAGTGYHAGLEMYYQHRLHDKQLPTVDECVEAALNTLHLEIRLVPAEQFLWSKEITDVDTADLKVSNMVRAYFDPESGGVWPDEWTVLGVEYGFRHKNVHGLPVRGTMDLVLRAPDGGVVVDDHKSAGRRWDQNKHKARKQNQPAFYRGVAEVEWPDAPYYRFVYSIMTYAGAFERRISDPGPEHVEATYAKAQQIVTLFKGMRSGGMDLPTNASSTLCSPAFCDHFTYCPAGAVLDT